MAHRPQQPLDNQQRERMRNVRKNFFEQTATLRDSLHQYQIAMMKNLRKEKPDTLTVDSLIDCIGRLQGEINRKAISTMLAEKQTLTPEQQEQFFMGFEDHICRYMMGPQHYEGGFNRREHRNQPPPERR